MLTRNPSEHSRDPREITMIDSEANNYFIRTVVTEAGKEDGMSILSIYILISLVCLTKKNYQQKRWGLPCY